MPQHKSRSTSRQKPRSSSRLWLIIAVVALVIVAGAAFILSQNGAAPEGTPVIQNIAPADYVSQFSEAGANHLLLDVRTPEEYAGGHIANSLNISVQTLESRLSEIPRDQPVVIYCRSGNRSAQAAQILAANGYTQIYDMGGINTWTAQGYPIQ